MKYSAYTCIIMLIVFISDLRFLAHNILPRLYYGLASKKNVILGKNDSKFNKSIGY